MTTKANVIQINELKKEYDRVYSDEISTAEQEPAYLGFSERLNTLIDMTDLAIPAIGSGRQTTIAKLVGGAKMSPKDWLLNDRPPKTTTLRSLIKYCLSHLKGGEMVTPTRVEAWLKYGEDTVPYPFDIVNNDDKRTLLIPLAISIITGIAKEANLSADQYDLNETLDRVTSIMFDLDITDQNDVLPIHKDIIRRLIIQK